MKGKIRRWIGDSGGFFKKLSPPTALSIAIMTVVIVALKLPRTAEFWKIAAQPMATMLAGIGAITAGLLAYLNGHRTRQQDRHIHESKELRAQEIALRERYTTITGQLADPSSAIRLAAVYALISLADNWRTFGDSDETQICIDLLRAYLREKADSRSRTGTDIGIERELREIIVKIIASRRKLPISDHKSWADSNTSLAKSSLPGCRLEEIDLSGIDLFAADLSGAKLYKTNLRDSSLRAATLNNASLYSANLSRCDLSFAHAKKTWFNSIEAPEANFEHAILTDAILWDSDLRGAKFDVADMQKCSISGADLQGATFVATKAQGGHFERADLTSANLQLSNLRGAELSDAKLVNANLSNSTITEANFLHADLTDADLSNSKIVSGKFFSAILHRTNLRNSDIQGCYFLDADLDSAVLSGANLLDARIHTAELPISEVEALLHLRVRLEVVHKDDSLVTVRQMPRIRNIEFTPDTIWPLIK